ncbi:hypothetical protein BBP40_010393 [Aspergillus hancockii]|nr:hypothetical protein BBP40_010393 [Aspergillus hancockii]
MESQNNYNLRGHNSNNHNSNNHNSEQSQSNNHSPQDLNYETPNTEPQTFDMTSEDPEYYRSFLAQLLDLVYNEDQATVDRLISTIRSGASQEDILAFIAQMHNGNTHVGEDGAVAPIDQDKHRER